MSIYTKNRTRFAQDQFNRRDLGIKIILTAALITLYNFAIFQL